jgi:hypothetical protein
VKDTSTLDFNFFARLHSFLELTVNTRMSEVLPVLVAYRQECFKKTSEEEEYRDAVINIIYARARILHAAEAYALYKLDIDYPMYKRSYDAFISTGDVDEMFPREEVGEGLEHLGREKTLDIAKRVAAVQKEVPQSDDNDLPL